MALSQGILEALPELIPRIVEVVEKIVTVIIENLPMLITAALQIMLALASGLIQAIPQLIVAIPRIIGGIFNALISGIPEILGFIPTLFKELVTAFSKIEWGTLGKNIISGIADGIKNAASSLATSVVNAAKGALGGAKNFLGIESPSKVFRDQVGSMIGAGMAEGITDSSKEVDAAMSGLNRKLDVNANVGVTGGRGYGSGINRNVVEHTGTIRVEGVNDDNQVFSVVEIVLNELRREVRV
jgi:phage-related protein